MIGLDTALKVCSDHLERDGCERAHALTKDLASVPVYLPEAHRPRICAVAASDNSVTKTCRAFYRGLPRGAGETLCPFGVGLRFQRLDVSGVPVCLYQQLDYTADNAPLQALPRRAKKRAKWALTGSTSLATADRARAKFERARDLLATLLTGRVAESIRGLSHHLLTPLQGALADYDQLRAGRVSPEEAIDRLGRNLKEIETSAKQIQILLSEDAEFSPRKLRKVLVDSVNRSVVQSLEPQALARHIRIEHVAAHNTRVQAIPDQLALVLSNLVQNAVKYSFDGSAEALRAVRITYAPRGEHLVVKITNVGCGIDSDEIGERRIFELGYRGRHSGDRGRQGTGTGLYLADKITVAHDGHLRVWSNRVATVAGSGVGMYETTFELSWPVYSRHQQG